MTTLLEKDGAPSLTDDQIEHLRERGWVVLRGIISPDKLLGYRPALRDYIMGHREKMDDVERAMGASAKKTMFSLGEAPTTVSEFVKSPLLGEIAAQLLGVDAVRVLHFCGFFKSGGGPPTPWHQDLSYIPLDTDKLLSLWIPLTGITPDMGALVFAEGSHLHGLSDKPWLAGEHFPLVQTGSMEAGDISVHMGWTLHASLKNKSTQMREALAVCYYSDGARIQTRGDVPFMRGLMNSCFAGLRPGDQAAGPLNPVVYRRQ
ncbi:MAG TPA: phytanoyl-CoA dioxygenase family protein [Pyrinomonadaceae bacterium]|jgi:ectoine hydroxylase-related dioxygenase (phytanoyl-CoA dioxygenase family)